MKNKRVLISGGLGFIFSHVTERLARHNAITVLDNLSDGSRPNLIQNWEKDQLPIRFVKMDVNEVAQITESYDIIIHAAAESNVDKSINEQRAFVHSNINGTLAMLDFARKQADLQAFLYINTDEVYGSTKKWCAVSDKINPANPYSASKAAGGHFCWAYQNTYNLPMQEVRMCNIIGRRQANTKLLPRLIERIASGDPMPIYDGGQFTREYMDVRDAAALIEAVIDDGEHTIHNLTFNQELSVIDVLVEVERQLGKKANPLKSSRPGHDQHYRMVPSRLIFNEVGFKRDHIPLRDTVAWVLSDESERPAN